MSTLIFHPAAGKSMASSPQFLHKPCPFPSMCSLLTGMDWEMEQHWSLHHGPELSKHNQLRFGWMALQRSGQQLQHCVAQPGAQLVCQHRVGLIRVAPQFAMERESTGLGVLFILVKLSFLWEIGGRRGPPDKGLL